MSKYGGLIVAVCLPGSIGDEAKHAFIVNSDDLLYSRRYFFEIF